MIGSPPVTVEVSHVHKSFRLPVARPDTLKERFVHPLHRTQHHEFKVLEDVSFEVHRGEFFGIAGRNGSGKSTLLKLMASVYRMDSGRIRVAGLLAPIIELGVGFQPDLSARANVTLNGLMMGLTAREAKRRFDAVIEFAELEEFVDLKLKNYSSGMRVRLAFAVMIQTDPDVMLLDEVLAVGDLAFQQRCEEVFEGFRRRGDKTIVLVTHSMSRVARYCERAMFLEGGRVEKIGDPREVAKHYTARLSSGSPPTPTPPSTETPSQLRPAAPVRILKLWLEDNSGGPSPTVNPGQDLVLSVSIQPVDQPVADPRLLFEIRQAGVRIFVPPPFDLGADSWQPGNGERVTVRATVENKLQPGRYDATCIVATGPRGDEASISKPATVQFDIPSGGGLSSGLLDLDYDVHVERDSGDGAPRGLVS